MKPDDAQAQQDQAITEFLINKPGSYQSYDPIKNAMRRHPGLTRETAEAMAAEFGF
jgi:hypothetical protein